MGAIKVPDEILDFIKKALEELKGTLKKGDIQNFVIDSALIRLDIMIPPEKENLREELESLMEKYNISIDPDEMGAYVSYPLKQMARVYDKIRESVTELREKLQEIQKFFEIFKELETIVKEEKEKI